MTFRLPVYVRCAILVSMLFAVCAWAAGQSEWIIHPFSGNGSGGNHPLGTLVADSAGNIYGTTYLGGAFHKGTVYELLPPVPPSNAWTEIVLYSFTGGIDGSGPTGKLEFDAAGNLYATAEESGGASTHGTVFELSPPSTEGGQWTETVLHSFQLWTSDGYLPEAGVTFDHSGNLYGSTLYGGPFGNNCGAGCGVVYELTPPTTPGAEWTETVIHAFNGRQGYGGTGAPIFGRAG